MRASMVWLIVLLMGLPALADIPSIEALAADPVYERMRLSPDGQHLAALVQIEGRRHLVVLERESQKVVAAFNFNGAGYGTEEVGWFRWLSPEKLIFNNVSRNSYDDAGRAFGELFVGDIRKRKMLTLFSGRRGGANTITVENRTEFGSASFLATLPGDEKHVLITVWPWNGGRFVDEAVPSVYRANIENGKLQEVLKGPMPGVRFVAGADGEIRYAYGSDAKLRHHVFERKSPRAGDSDWHEIAVSDFGEPAMQPLQVSADGHVLYYLREENEQSVLVARELVTGSETDLAADPGIDEYAVKFDSVSGHPLWLNLGADPAQTTYFNTKAPVSKAHRALVKAFAPAHVQFTGQTHNGSELLFRLSYDREPGSYYLFNTVTNKAALYLTERPQLLPDQLVAMTPIKLKARDGLPLSGYFTAASGLTPAKLPMVVLVHGGPYFVQDAWQFDSEVQLLATRGYAVLQINFRGSSGYGLQFQTLGYREWGGKMQDDVTDATRWAVQQGLADPARICIMGASYGGYASLMGVIREPELYRCAVDIAGVSDLELMFDDGDIIARMFGESYLQQALGNDRNLLATRSPTKLAAGIKVPVLLIHGGQDERVPISHARLMEAALRKHDKQVETLYIDSEGHGFFLAKNREVAYQRVLDFLTRQLRRS